MFDFQSTLDSADEYAKKGDYALADFHYWLIDFAYQDEEFPYYYTPSIGAHGFDGFVDIMNEHHSSILQSDSYKNFKGQMNCFSSYRRYFENFERDVANYQPVNKKPSIIKRVFRWLKS